MPRPSKAICQAQKAAAKVSFRDVVGDFAWPGRFEAEIRPDDKALCHLSTVSIHGPLRCGCLSYQAVDKVTTHDVLVDEVAMARYGGDPEIAGRCVSIVKVALHHDNIWWFISG